MKKIAVLLTVHNRKVATIKCLEELHRQELSIKCKIDIYMTDDGCTDGTAEVVSSIFPEVNIIKGNGQLYWNRGMIAAWEEAIKHDDYDYYLWINDDTFLFDNCVDVLVRCSEQKDEKSIIVGATSDTMGKNIVTYSGYIKPNVRVIPNGELQYCDFFNGNIVLIPRLIFQAIGMNDIHFRHSRGDWDYGLRAKKKNFYSYVAPMVLGRCDRHDCIPTWCNPSKKMKQRYNSFFSPLGVAPREALRYDLRHNGMVKAVRNQVSCFIKFVWPNLFIKRLKENKSFFTK